MPEYSVTSQTTASFVKTFSVTFKFNVAGTKSDIVIQATSVNTSPYLKATQYIKDVKFKFFFLNGLPGDSNFQHQGRDC